MRIHLQNQRGFTLIEILLVVAIIGLLVTLAIPNFVKARSSSQTNLCISNLKQLESAKQIWGVETGKKDGDTPIDTDLIGPLLYLKAKPDCPAGGDYLFNQIGENASCTVGGGHAL